MTCRAGEIGFFQTRFARDEKTTVVASNPLRIEKACRSRKPELISIVLNE